MKLKRDDLLDHLTRISCHGQVREVVFTGAFAAAALTPDHLLLVTAPPLLGAEPLPEPVGVADLETLIKALGMVPGSEDDIGVDVRLEDHRLVIDEEGRGRVRLLTAAPRTIATRIEPNIVEALLAKIGTTVVPLTSTVTVGVQAAYAGLKAKETELLVGPDGGLVRVGDEASHVAEFPIPVMTAAEAYSLNFGEHLIDVLATVGSEAVLYLAGPKKAVAVQDGEFNYVLGPRSYSADRKRAVTKAGKQAAEPAPEPAAAE